LNVDKNALVSIACVQNNRLEIKKMSDIESYTYLNNELSQLPINSKGNSYKDLNYLEQVLLVKGWRRYTWQGLEKINAVDTIVKSDSLLMTGVVVKSKKELTTSTTLSVFGNGNFRLLQTSNTGTFNFNSPELISESKKNVYLLVGDKNRLSYQIKIKDPFVKMNQNLAKNSFAKSIIIPSTLLNNVDLVLQGNEKAIRLREVVINSKKNNDFNFGKGLPGTNACGDYVCRYNILNCRNHIGDSENTQPIPGKAYLTDGTMRVYMKCEVPTAIDETFVKYNGIHVQKEFYLSDYKDPVEPAFFSTIYWNYATVINAGIETELSFYSSDIIGKFRIIVQGVTNKDVIYAENFFEVIGK
ncbi:MAG: hypothetical protein WC622_02375, partial [Pedobacter sp.]|uniref:hypothetical protein n=1 Tax=Pedobacter sp. TaxID=1411316 RepID=UPI003562181B